MKQNGHALGHTMQKNRKDIIKLFIGKLESTYLIVGNALKGKEFHGEN